MDDIDQKPCGKFHTHVAHTWEDNFKKVRCHGAMDGKLNYHPLTEVIRKPQEPVGLTAREFADRIHDRVKWILENCPELMARPVMVISEETADQASDIFVEEFLCIRIP